MILKIIPGKNKTGYALLINYILEKDKQKGEERQVITHNLKSVDDIGGWMKEFRENESFRLVERKNSNRFTHEILTFSKLDREFITKEKVADVARKYIEERGGKGVYLGAVHEDRENFHAHFIVSGLEYRSGKSFRMSKQNLHLVKTNIQSYHKTKYPELSKSLVEHGKGREYATDREYRARQRNERGINKDRVKETVTVCLANAANKEQFIDHLQKEGLQVYERSGRMQGVIHDGLKYRFSGFGIGRDQLEKLAVQIQKDFEERDNKVQESGRNNNTTQNEKYNQRALTTLQINDVRQELDRLYQDKHGLFLQITQKGFSNEKLGRDLDAIILRESYLINKEQELSNKLDQIDQHHEKVEKEDVPESPSGTTGMENLIDSEGEYQMLDENEVQHIEADILNELEDLRNETEERDLDELDRDWDDDDFDR